MQRIQGDELPTAWPKLSEESRRKFFDQPKDVLRDLRSLKSPSGTGLESCTGASLRGSRIPRSCTRLGPFKTIREFHLWLREGLQLSSVNRTEWRDSINRFLDPFPQELKMEAIRQI